MSWAVEMQGRGAAVLIGEVQFLGTQRLGQRPKRRGETPPLRPCHSRDISLCPRACLR